MIFAYWTFAGRKVVRMPRLFYGTCMHLTLEMGMMLYNMSMLLVGINWNNIKNILVKGISVEQRAKHL